VVYTAPVISGSRARIAAIAASLLVVALALGYWGLRKSGERALHTTVVALVSDASGRLREALERESDPARIADPEIAGRLDQHAGEIDQRLAALQRLRAAPNRALVDAADLYLVTARELLRKMSAGHGQREAFAGSVRALRALAETADRRSSAWIAQTIAAKERAERDYADYRRTVDTIASLLDSLAEPRARLAREIDPARLIDEALRAQAADRARAAGKRAAAELERAQRPATRQ